MSTTAVAGTRSEQLPDGLRECDSCGKIEDAGEWPDWRHGMCPECDPTLLAEIDEHYTPLEVELILDERAHEHRW